MNVLRALVVVALLAVAGYIGYRFASHSGGDAVARSVAVYYVKPESDGLAKWSVSLSPKTTDIESVAFYATAQVLAGPPADTQAIRFPAGTIARSVRVADATATVDLGGAITTPQGGSYGESGELKALVWTLTGLHGITSVRVVVDGERVATLPGGHVELDEPLTRQSF
ncbi:MAG: hypothetical protein NVSMB21_06530 [Vulcanimicrobiaceae bacterium]